MLDKIVDTNEDKLKKAFAELIEKTNLRKWCVERAIEIQKADQDLHPVKLAEAIFDFVTKRS